MAITVEATYENGVLKLAQPLPLQQNERVRVTIETEPRPIVQARGILRWEGDHETLQRLAENPEFDPQEKV